MEKIGKDPTIVDFPTGDKLKQLKDITISRNDLRKSELNAEVVGISDLQEKREKEKQKRDLYGNFLKLQKKVSDLMKAKVTKNCLQESKKPIKNKVTNYFEPIPKEEEEKIEKIKTLPREVIINEVLNYNENTVNNNNLHYYSSLIDKIITEGIFPLGY